MIEKIGSKALTSNPALKSFERFMGEWQITGSHPYLSGAELHGRASFSWLEGGAFVVIHSEIDNEHFPDGVEIFGSDDVSKEYFMLHFDERGTSRKYDVSIEVNGISWWRDDSEFSQKFSLVIHDDRTMSSTGRMRRKGAEWEDDLALVYKRI